MKRLIGENAPMQVDLKKIEKTHANQRLEQQITIDSVSPNDLSQNYTFIETHRFSSDVYSTDNRTVPWLCGLTNWFMSKFPDRIDEIPIATDEKDSDFRYALGDKEIVLIYGAAEKAYRILVDNPVKLETFENELLLRKHE